MKAAWYEQQGSADKVLSIGEMPCPPIGENDVLIRVYASGINPSDVKKRNGIRGEMAYPRIIPHSDGAGMIEAVGKNISKISIGQRVWIYNAQWNRTFGTAAEYIVLPAELAVPLPDNISFEEGACLGVPAFTAHRAVFAEGPVGGKIILVTGGAGNVGRYAIQLAKWGNATVISTVSSSEKAQYAKDAGADFVINYHEENIIEKINLLTHNQGVDGIVEVDFGANLNISKDIIKHNGYISTYASTANPTPEFPFYPLMFKGINIHLVDVYNLPDNKRIQAIQDITSALESNSLTSVIGAIFPLEEIIAAHQRVENGKTIGNILLLIK